MMQRSHRPLGRPRKDPEEKSTKEIILNLATELFLEKGYPSVSMDDVAKQSNVTKATVYYYYKTKADLFTDAMGRLMLRIAERIEVILATEEPLKDQLFHLAKVHLQATVDININAFMKEAKISLSDEQQALMKEAEDKMYGVLEAALKKAMERGEIPPSSPLLAAHMFVSILAVGNSIDIEQQDEFDSLDDLVTQIIQLFWNGLSDSRI